MKPAHLPDSLNSVDTSNGRTPTHHFTPGPLPVDIAAIVVAYNSENEINELISTLRNQCEYLSIRLIVVDNCSSDRTTTIVSQHDDITLLRLSHNQGYAAGINAGRAQVGPAKAILILNPDITLHPGSLEALANRLQDPTVGAVVPMILDSEGTVYPSLRNEPSLLRALGDAVLGAKFPTRPAELSETIWRAASYRNPLEVAWATGAAVLVPAEVDAIIGSWDEDFFLYSEETDYFRRVRNAGFHVWYEPTARVAHLGGASGTSPSLQALMAANRVLYVAKHHGRIYAASFTLMAVLRHTLRAHNRGNRLALEYIFNFWMKRRLPAKHFFKRTVEPITQSTLTAAPVHDRPTVGAVDTEAEAHTPLCTIIIPAHNEASVIKRTLEPLASEAASGRLKVIVVPNGCSDETAAIARSIPGIQVAESNVASKAHALNLGDKIATSFPRLYLDADISISPRTVLATACALRDGEALAARPAFTTDTQTARPIVRSYFRARNSIPASRTSLWGAGAYGLSKAGHTRLGAFPELTGDDLWVDQLFRKTEKRIITECEPVVVHAPQTAKGLLAILRRTRTGNAEVSSILNSSSQLATCRQLLAGIRGPVSAFDAAVYAAISIVARIQVQIRPRTRWERDESSRRSSETVSDGEGGRQ